MFFLVRRNLLGQALLLHGVELTLFGIHTLDEDDVLIHIALIVEHHIAGDTGIGHAGERLGDGVGISGTGGLDGLNGHHIGVIAQSGHSGHSVAAASSEAPSS